MKNLIKLGEPLWINVNDLSRGIIFVINGCSEAHKHNQIILSKDIGETRARSRVARAIIYCALVDVINDQF